MKLSKLKKIGVDISVEDLATVIETSKMLIPATKKRKRNTPNTHKSKSGGTREKSWNTIRNQLQSIPSRSTRSGMVNY